MSSSDLSARAAVLPALVQVLHGLFHDLDARRYDAVVAGFTPDGRWLRQGVWQVGRVAIAAALRERPGHVETCHILSNACVTACEGDKATLDAYMTAYRYPTPDAPDAVPVISGALRINHVVTVFARQSDGHWRIAEQRLVPRVGFHGA